jgi:hypothetical protein
MAQLKLTMYAPGECPMHRWKAKGCEAEVARMKVTARRHGKPAMYTWPLWHQPRQPDRYEPETVVEVIRRQLLYKPAGYTWKPWWQHKPARAYRKAA